MHNLLAFTNLTDTEFFYAIAVVLIAGIVRGFSGFGLSAIIVASLTIIIPPVEIVPVILLLEIAATIWMLPSIWNNVQWRFLFIFFIGIIFGTPIGIHLLKHFDKNIVSLAIAIGILVLSILLVKGYTNTKLNNGPSKVAVGFIAGLFNGIGTVGGLVLALYYFVICLQPVSIRASLAAQFILIDVYAIAIIYIQDLLSSLVFARTLVFLAPLFLGIYIGSHFFTKSSVTNYKRYVLYFLITLAVVGMLKHSLVLI